MLSNYKDVLTVSHLVEILQKERNEVYKLLNDGEIKSFRIERKFLVLKVDLLHYINKACMSG